MQKPSETIADVPVVRAFIQDAEGDHNFDFLIQQRPSEFVRGLRENGGYYVPAQKEGKVSGVVFVPWHQIHFIRFEEVEK